MTVRPFQDYAAPLVAFDRIIRMDNSGITTMKAVTANECTGHFPDHPIYPGVFIIEAVNQATKCHAAAYYGRVSIVEVRSVRFLSPALPGNLLEYDCRCTSISSGRQLQVEAICWSQQKKVAEVKLIYRLEEDL